MQARKCSISVASSIPIDFGVPARVVFGGLGTARTAAEPQRRAFREFFVVSLVAFMLSVFYVEIILYQTI